MQELPCEAKTFRRLWDHADAWLDGNDPRTDTCLSEAASSSVTLLNNFAGTTLRLRLEGRGSFSAFASSDSEVVIGMGFLRVLENSCRQFCDYLVSNYVHQQAGMGPTIPLPILTPARDFPSRALSLYEEHMLPKAAMAPSEAEAMMAMLRMLVPAGALTTASEMRAGAGWISKPWLDLAEVEEDWRSSRAMMPTPRLLAHSILLFGRVFDDVLSFVVGHEGAHIVLGHVTSVTVAERSQADEISADAWAATQLRKVPEFDPRSVALLFAFLAHHDDEDRTPELRSHPFPSSRLSVLAAAGEMDEALRNDLDAASRLLRQQATLDTDAIIDTQPTATLLWSANTRKTLEVELLSPPRSSKTFLELVVEIRDAVNSRTVYRVGKVCLSLKEAAREQIHAGGERCTWTLPLPASWWLDHPTAAASVRSGRLFQSITRGGLFDCPERLDRNAALAAIDGLAVSGKDLAIQAVVATRHERDDKLATEMASRLWRLGVALPGDMRLWLSSEYLGAGDSEASIALMQPVVDSGVDLVSGDRVTLATALWRSIGGSGIRLFAPSRDASLVAQCLDLAWRENMLGQGTSAGKRAGDLLVEIIRAERNHPLVRAMIEYGRRYEAASKLALAEVGDHGAGEFLAVGDLWSSYLEHAKPTVIALQSAGEAILAAAVSRPELRDRARHLFDLAVQKDRGFLPALTEGAKTALLDEDLREASRLINLAGNTPTGPAHEFARYVGTEVKRRIMAKKERLDAAIAPYVKSQQFQAAMAEIARDEELLALDGDVHGWLGRLAFQVGLWDEAREAFGVCLERNGDEFDPLVHRAICVLEAGEIGSASDLLLVALGYATNLPSEEMVRRHSGQIIMYSHDVTLALAETAWAWCTAQLGDVDLAVRHVANIGSRENLSGLTCFYMAEILALAGDKLRSSTMARSSLDAEVYPLRSKQVSRATMLAGAGS